MARTPSIIRRFYRVTGIARRTGVGVAIDAGVISIHPESSGEMLGAAVAFDVVGGVTPFALAPSKFGTDGSEAFPGRVRLTSCAFFMSAPTKKRQIVTRQITQVIRSRRPAVSCWRHDGRMHSPQTLLP